MEGDTIILSERDMVNGVLQEKDVRYPINVDGRIIRVAHLYIHARVLVSRCFQICSINNSFSVSASFSMNTNINTFFCLISVQNNHFQFK